MNVPITFIEVVFIETDPYSSTGVIDGEYTALPQPFLDELGELYANQDGRACWRCDQMTGYVLEDGLVSERIAWQPTGLARTVDEVNGPVAVLCAECAPYVPSVGPRTEAVR